MMYDPKTPEEYAIDVIRRANIKSETTLFHHHKDIEFFFDLRADTENGPRTYHGIGWVCRCGRIEYGKSCREDAYAAREFNK